jgi:hypothetical protein
MMAKKSSLLVRSSVAVLALLAGVLPPSGAITLPGRSTRPAQAAAESAAEYTYANCRVGMAAWPDQAAAFDFVQQLNAGWYLDFSVHWSLSGPPTAEFVQMVYVTQDRGGSTVCGPDYGYSVWPALTPWGLGALVDAQPGSLWIIGNEPDRIGQGDTCPQQYAQAYHDIYYFIKGRDPTAQVAPAGLVQFTPMRRQYLDLVWNSYVARYGEAMPADAWTLHVYVLSETGGGDAHLALGTDPALAIPYSNVCSDPNTFCHAEHDDINLFIEQVRRMRTWMRDHGQRNKPLLITEYSLLKPYNYYGICNATNCYGGDIDGCFCDETKRTFHPGRVADFVQASFNYLFTATDSQIGYPYDSNRLVQQWLWYRLATTYLEELGHASNLAKPTAGYALTEPGVRWQQIVKAMPPSVNLFPVAASGGVVRSPNGSDPVTATLRVVAMNNGNTALSQPVVVTFYRDAGLTQAVATGTLSYLGGCARPQAVIEAQWANVNSGRHTFYAKLDSTNLVAESNENDNVIQGTLWVNYTRRALLPLVSRGT